MTLFVFVRQLRHGLDNRQMSKGAAEMTANYYTFTEVHVLAE